MTMDDKGLILEFQYSEKIKSYLITGSSLLAHLDSMRGEERGGAEKIVKAYLHSLRTEIRMARETVKSVTYHGAEKNVTESIGRLEMDDLANANMCLSQALNYITTSCETAMTHLQKRNLL